MKKLALLFSVSVLVLCLTCCGRSINDIAKNEPSITGTVEEVCDNSLLIYIQTTGYPFGAYCSVSLDTKSDESAKSFSIGDEVTVYYDGYIAESDPLQINTVYAITLKAPAYFKK